MSTIGTALSIANQSISFVYCDGCSREMPWLDRSDDSQPHAAAVEKYRIQSGDTLSRLAQRFGTSITQLKTANAIGNVDFIRAGDAISIPR